jgi:hypothetical protein
LIRNVSAIPLEPYFFADVKYFLRTRGFQESDIVVLTDDTNDPSRYPSKANIIQWMRWLAHGPPLHKHSRLPRASD